MLEVPKQQNCSKKDFLNGIDHLENPATEVTHHGSPAWDEDILYGLPLTCWWLCSLYCLQMTTVLTTNNYTAGIQLAGSKF